MLRLLEITLTNGKESVALYPAEGSEPYADGVALMSDFETKIGQAMKADAYKAEFLLAFDNDGHIYGQKYISKGEEYTLSPRLIWAQTKNSIESADQSKKDDTTILEADYHIKKGSAMADTTISKILLIGFDGVQTPIIDYWKRPTEE